jgi:hypothetical protein
MPEIVKRNTTTHKERNTMNLNELSIIREIARNVQNGCTVATEVEYDAPVDNESTYRDGSHYAVQTHDGVKHYRTPSAAAKAFVDAAGFEAANRAVARFRTDRSEAQIVTCEYDAIRHMNKSFAPLHAAIFIDGKLCTVTVGRYQTAVPSNRYALYIDAERFDFDNDNDAAVAFVRLVGAFAAMQAVAAFY